MTSPRRLPLLLSLCLALTSLAGLAWPANAVSLADLAGGGSLATADGSLVFSNFSVSLPATVGGDANALAGLDLSIFEVEAFADSVGFRVLELDGPIAVGGSQVGSLRIDFDVVAGDGFAISGVALSMTATAIGAGALAEIVETISGAGGSAALHVVRESGGAQQLIDELILAEAAQWLHISKDILVDVRDAAALAVQISEIEQRFSTVEAAIPEPGAAALFATGLLLLAPRLRR